MLRTKRLPSQILNRLEEHFDAVLAEDLAILSYRHDIHGNRTSPFRRFIEHDNQQLNANFRETTQALRQVDMENFKAILDKQAKKAETKSEIFPFQDHLEPVVKEAPPSFLSIYDQLPKIQSVSLFMTMPQAITHSKKVLMNGMLALNLCTGQQCQIRSATKCDHNSKLRTRIGMPLGVQVKMTDPQVFGDFLGKLVEVVLPKLRDFRGFSRATSDISQQGPQGDNVLILRMDAESWQSFPEIQQSYQKFPSNAAVGALQDYEIHIKVSGAKSAEECRMLLSGYRVPFTFLEDKPIVEVEEEEEVQEV